MVLSRPATPPLCDYCRRPALRVTGAAMYRNRPDLADKVIWLCRPCDAWVGSHPGTDIPLGRLANAELRRAKMAAHAAFDPLWQARVAAGESKKKARNGAYEWLAGALGIPRETCHIGMMDAALCRRVVEVCRARRNEMEAA